MKRRMIAFGLILAMVLALCPNALAAQADQPAGAADIRAAWKQITTASHVFEQAPSVKPYAPGQLSEDFLHSGLDYLNFIRMLAGLPAVELRPELCQGAQCGAVLLAANDAVETTPACPEGMEDPFYQQALEALKDSIPSCPTGYAPVDVLKGALEDTMNVCGSPGDWAGLQRRYQLLDPQLAGVGFGYAQSASGKDYVLVNVSDRSGSAVDNPYIAWPSAGAFPVELLDEAAPWSVTLNPESYQIPDADAVQVTLTRQSDGTTWTFDQSTGASGTSGSIGTSDASGSTGSSDAAGTSGSTGSSGAAGSSGSTGAPETPGVLERPYCAIDAANGCIAFHPGTAQTYEGVYTVKITGLTDAGGAAADLLYNVEFFRLVCEEHSWGEWEILTAATCTDDGLRQRTCTVCGQTEQEVLLALGHDWAPWEELVPATCTELGQQKRACTRCDAEEAAEIPLLPHPYDDWRVTAPAQCTVSGSQERTCTACGHVDTAPLKYLGHAYQVTQRVDSTCRHPGYEISVCDRCGQEKKKSLPLEPHTWGPWLVTKAAGVNRPGEETSTCSVCGWKQRRETAPLVNPFTDVGDESSPYFTPILWAVEEGITTGTSGTTFSPNSTCTRGQFVTLLWRAAGAPAPVNTASKFADVRDPSQYYHQAVLWAVERGITTGVSSTRFDPNGAITRGQAAAFFYRYDGGAPTAWVNPFRDVSPTQYYYRAVLWAVSHGITNGTSAATFSPDAFCTRGQMVTFLYRYQVEPLAP